ncbi:ABC transporter ATP-binding protein [Streptomyces sp. RKAG290]|uniref:ABC transporter ATP-binding protein n=1 Tax=Streptomyces sp. RKAG290 TaxID=2888348 RepID=UPI002033CE90|nr:ABC transporter ATP-binding protein [Streptomyces sp. RKAG290]MCM2410704.1 ABC transporter ATP-binding protein [Streptomyces sp. RKAG290]
MADRTPAPTAPAGALLEVSGLRLTVPGAGGVTEVVHGVDFTLRRGRTLGLVGESGSGKTLTCRAVLGVLPDGCRVSAGSIRFDGQEVTGLDHAGWLPLRAVRIGAVFQDPGSFLTPSRTVGTQLAEVLRVRGGHSRRAARTRALELLSEVGLREPARVARQIPGRLSGGMQQRVMLALAVSCGPDLLVADEPTTALDVRTQRDVLGLLGELRERLGLALLFVSHDLEVVAELCDDIAVFRHGEIVEAAPAAELVTRPTHPYSRTLLTAAGLLEEEERYARP